MERLVTHLRQAYHTHTFVHMLLIKVAICFSKATVAGGGNYLFTKLCKMSTSLRLSMGIIAKLLLPIALPGAILVVGDGMAADVDVDVGVDACFMVND